MKNFKHKNILGLVGVSVGVENDMARPYIVLPFMANKDLKKYLQSKRTEAGKNLEAISKVSFSIIRYPCSVQIISYTIGMFYFLGRFLNLLLKIY